MVPVLLCREPEQLRTAAVLARWSLEQVISVVGDFLFCKGAHLNAMFQFFLPIVCPWLLSGN